MTPKTKLLKATRKMKLLVSLVAGPVYSVLLVLIAHTDALLAQTPQQQAGNTLRAGVNQKIAVERAQAVRALPLLPGDTKATDQDKDAKAASHAMVGLPNSIEKQRDGQNTMVWTNDDLEKLQSLGLISIVGRSEEEISTPAASSGLQVRTTDTEWYAAQATKLRHELDRRQTQLREYQQSIEDVRNLEKTTGGVNLDEGDLAITPEVGTEILERHVNEVQTDINELEDEARRHDIPPGTLRGQ
jgi:hypothetical protein